MFLIIENFNTYNLAFSSEIQKRIKKVNPWYWYLIESISSMLGHKSIRTPQIYSKVIKAKVCEDMGKLKRKLSLLVATFLAVFRNITYQLHFQKSKKIPDIIIGNLKTN